MHRTLLFRFAERCVCRDRVNLRNAPEHSKTPKRPAYPGSGTGAIEETPAVLGLYEKVPELIPCPKSTFVSVVSMDRVFVVVTDKDPLNGPCNALKSMITPNANGLAADLKSNPNAGSPVV